MAGANRFVKVVRFTHTGAPDTLSEVVEVPESFSGRLSVFNRRVSGTGSGYIEAIYGSFESSGANGYQVGSGYSNWEDTLTQLRNGDDNQFPYLRIEADFQDDEGGDSTTVEVYIIGF